MCKRDVNMATLILTVGCSGSGKSTYTEDFLKYHDAVNLNRDDVRFTLISQNAKGWGDYLYNDFNEGIVTTHIQAKFLEAVNEGKDIIVSDTNLNKTIREDWIQQGFDVGYNVKVIIFNPSFQKLMDHNSFREKPLDFKAIQSQHSRFVSFLNTPLIEGVEYIVSGV